MAWHSETDRRQTNHEWCWLNSANQYARKMSAYKSLSTINCLDPSAQLLPGVGHHGRAVMMGLLSSDLPVSYLHFGMQNQTIRGQFMYERADLRGLTQLVEKGLLRLGAEGGYQLRGKCKLEDIDECLRATAAGS